jgi:hypothetical protein
MSNNIKKLVIVDGNSIRNSLINPFNGRDDKNTRIDFNAVKQMFPESDIVWLAYRRTRRIFEKYFKVQVFNHTKEIPFLVGRLIGQNPDTEITFVSFLELPWQFNYVFSCNPLSLPRVVNIPKTHVTLEAELVLS